MATINFRYEAPTKVKTFSLYKVEEDNDERLVLRAKTIGAFLGGAVLTFMGLVMLFATWLTARGDNPVWLAVVAGLFAVLLLLGGIGLFRVGFTNEDRIVVDRRAGEVRLPATPEGLGLPFADLERVDVRYQDRSIGNEVRITFPVYLVTKGGDEFKVDEASDVELMKGLAEKISKLSGVRLQVAQPR